MRSQQAGLVAIGDRAAMVRRQGLLPRRRTCCQEAGMTCLKVGVNLSRRHYLHSQELGLV